MSINSSDWHSDKENLKEQAMNCGYYIWYWLKTFIRIQPSQEWNLLHIMKYGFSFEFLGQCSLLTARSSVLLHVSACCLFVCLSPHWTFEISSVLPHFSACCLFVCPPINLLKYPTFCRMSLLVVCLPRLMNAQLMVCVSWRYTSRTPKSLLTSWRPWHSKQNMMHRVCMETHL